jgi:HlyD family secretion protein
MSKQVKWILISVVAIIALLGGLKAAGVFGKDEGTKVTAEKVQRRTITEIVNASGKIYPEIEVKVSPDISGEITELNVQEGDTVKKGTVVARIYADLYSLQSVQAASGVAQSQAQVSNSTAALDALKAQKEQAEKTYQMQKRLFDEKVISTNEFNVAEASYKTAQANFAAAQLGIKGGQASVQSARANLARANKDLGRTVIVAPMDGVVSLLNVKKGEKVAGNSFNVGTEMLRIADMSKIEIRVDVGESDIPKVHVGDSAIVTVDAYSDRKFKGLVTQISSSNNGASSISALANTSTDVTNYKVYVRLLPESYTDLLGKGTFPFRPGMSASADIQTKTHKDVLSVPINAVTTRDINQDSTEVKDKKIAKKDEEKIAVNADELEVVVFVLQIDGTVKKTRVKTEIQDINNIEITEGLKEGDQVITGPYELVSKTLKSKDRVKVVDKKELFTSK